MYGVRGHLPIAVYKTYWQPDRTWYLATGSCPNDQEDQEDDEVPSQESLVKRDSVLRRIEDRFRSGNVSIRFSLSMLALRALYAPAMRSQAVPRYVK